MWHSAEAMLGRRGYSIEWRPTAMRDRVNQLDCHFELAAAHLMLRKKDVFFVEIGANDGIANDPIYPFVRDHGWQGLMLEPLPEIHAKLTKNHANHPGINCIQAAISQHDGDATIYTVDMAESQFTKAHQFSSFRKDIVLSQIDWVPNIAELITEMRVRTMSWPTLMKQTGGRHIDVVQIDTEGFDAEILRMMDLSEWKPSIIHYEHCNLSKSDQEECASRLAENGYALAMNRLDVIAYRLND